MNKKILNLLPLCVLFALLSCGGSSESSTTPTDTHELSFTKSIETIDSDAASGHAISIALDQNGNPGISYISYGTNDILNFKYKSSGTWSATTATLSDFSIYSMTSTAVTSTGDYYVLSAFTSGSSALYKKQTLSFLPISLNTTTAMQHPAIAIDKDDCILIAYYDSVLKTLMYSKYSGSSWSTAETVDSTENAGWYCAITADNNGKAHVLYYDSVNRSMKYATNKSGSWVAETIANDINTEDSSFAYYNDGEKYWSLKADSNGYIHISYYNYTADSLYYATNSSGEWEKTLLDGIWQGRNNSLGIDSKNKVHISYYNQYTGSLRYITNKNGSWQYSDIETPSAITSHIGDGTALAVDSSDNIHIAYQDYSEVSGTNHQIVKYVKLTY
jgi:hypothetical protein